MLQVVDTKPKVLIRTIILIVRAVPRVSIGTRNSRYLQHLPGMLLEGDSERIIRVFDQIHQSAKVLEWNVAVDWAQPLLRIREISASKVAGIGYPKYSRVWRPTAMP